MENPLCPQCGLNDQVEKVSTLYFEALGGKGLAGQKAGAGAPGDLPKRPGPGLRRLFAPPASGKAQATRPIHPDLVVVVFTGILPVFLAGIARSQPQMVVPVLSGLALVYGLYFWFRKKLVDRFQVKKQTQVDEKRRVERAIGRWMRAYYCTRDEIVFEAGRPGWAPVEQLGVLLMGGGED